MKYYNVIKWMFSYWPCYRSESSRIGLRFAVLAQGSTSGKYTHPKANTTAGGPV